MTIAAVSILIVTLLQKNNSPQSKSFKDIINATNIAELTLKKAYENVFDYLE